MVTAKVLIKRKGDESSQKELTDYMEGDIVQGGILADMIIFEGGMESGRTSVSLHVILEDGSHAVVQTSAAIFYTMASALKGAERRFLE